MNSLKEIEIFEVCERSEHEEPILSILIRAKRV